MGMVPLLAFIRMSVSISQIKEINRIKELKVKSSTMHKIHDTGRHDYPSPKSRKESETHPDPNSQTDLTSHRDSKASDLQPGALSLPASLVA